MSKSNKINDRLKNAKRREENREDRHEARKLLKEGRYDELDHKENIRPIKEVTNDKSE